MVYYARFEMLHTEVKFLQSNNLLFNPMFIILGMSSTLFQYDTILTRKVQIYFEVMINYIIALTLHARRNNLMSFCSYQHSHWWYYNCHEFILDWLCVHSCIQTLCIKQGVSDLHWHQFCSCHDDSPQFSSVKPGRQQMWVRQKEFVWVVPLMELAVLHCWNTLPLQNIYLLDVVWLLL